MARTPYVGVLAFLISMLSGAPLLAGSSPWPWLDPDQPVVTGDCLEKRFPPPKGFHRIAAATDTFEHWLRRLPLKPGVPAIQRYDGRTSGHRWHAAVLDIDCGTRDLQQCADSAIRLRAEYLRATNQNDAIRFNFTSGHPARWSDWREGMRPAVNGNHVRWRQSAEPDSSYSSFRRYLDGVFTYAGTWSLAQELQPITEARALRAGDLVLQGGFPGHAILLADSVTDPESGRRVFLLVQGYNPAEEIHVIVNPNDASLSPWYELEPGAMLVTPGWTFESARFHRWRHGRDADGQ